jgi:hypothetical protein
MQKFIFFLLAFGLVTPMLMAQSFSIGLGGGYTAIQPPGKYNFNYTEEPEWPSTISIKANSPWAQGVLINGQVSYDFQRLPLQIVAGFSGGTFYNTIDSVLVGPAPPWS